MTPFEKASRAHIASCGSSGTRDLYTADLDRWLAFCAQRGVDPAAPELTDAAAFRDEALAGLAGPTVRRIIGTLSALFNNAVDGGGRPVVAWNPFKKLARPPAVKFGKTREVAEDDAKRVFTAIETCTGPLAARDLAMLRLLYDVGLRVSSVVELKREQLYRRGEQLIISGVFAKGGKEVEAEVPEACAVALARWLETAPESQWVFPGRGGGHFQTKAVNKRLLIYGDLAGVKKLHPHRFRASFITQSLDAGVPLYEVQAAVHHEDPKTTLRYDRRARGAGVTTALAKFRERKSETP